MRNGGGEVSKNGNTYKAKKKKFNNTAMEKYMDCTDQ